MALVLKDRVKETSTTAGTGTITLAGAASGFQSFSAIGNGNSTYYAIVDPATGDWEVGIGTYTSSGTTLSRTTVLSSSTGGSLVPFAANTKDVFVTYPSEKGVWLDSSGVVSATSFGAITATSAALTSGTITTAPTNATDIVNKEYADSISSGLNYHQPVIYASTTTLPAYTYNNGSSGVGATITANANGALSLGGGSPTATQRVLIKDEAGGNAAYNGVYVVTQAGSAGTPFILTRATDYDTSGTGTNEIDQGDYVLVISGTLASTAWVQQTPLPITVGTTALTFLQFNAPITYNAGTGLNLSPATTFNISNTGVTASTYGSASAVPVFAVNAQGQITSVTNTNIAINGSAVSGNISGQAGSVANSLTAGTYLTGTAFNGSAAQTWTVDATSANTASKVVARDASGDFSAGTITAALSGNATTATTATNVAGGAANQIVYNSSAGTTTFAAAPSASGQYLSWNGSAYSWVGTIPTTSGGTGLTSFTANGVVYASSTSALTTGTGLLFDGSSLGIGNPTVYGTRSINAYTGTTASAVGFSQQISGFANTWVGSNNSGSTVLGMATGTFGQSTTNNIPWTVSAYGSEQMRLTSTGLGIGTTGLSSGKISALVDLSTANGLVVRDSATTYANNDNFVLLQNSAGATAGGLTHPAASSLGVWGNDDIRFLQSSSATEQMRLTSTGLGIGNSSPAVKLVVGPATGAQNTARIYGDNSTNNAPVLSLFRTAARESVIAQTTSGLAFANTAGLANYQDATIDAAANLTITSAGNVGVGTTSPGCRLDVRGTSLISAFDNATGVYSRWKYNGTNVGIIGTANQVVSGGSTSGFAIGTELAGELVFATNNTERFRIGTAGQLGIGSTPSYGTSGQVLTSNGSGAAPSWQTSAAAAKGFAVGMSLVFGR